MTLWCDDSLSDGGWVVWGLQEVAPDSGILVRFFPDVIMVCGIMTARRFVLYPRDEMFVVVNLEEVTAETPGAILAHILEALPSYPWEGKVDGPPTPRV